MHYGLFFADQGCLPTLSKIGRYRTDGITVDQHGIVERLAQWVLCAGSLVLWLLLVSDLNNALWWAVKAPSPRYWISGNVRLDKVALCLAWSLLILLFYAYRYGMAARAILALLASVLLVQVVDAAMKLNIVRHSLPEPLPVPGHAIFFSRDHVADRPGAHICGPCLRHVDKESVCADPRESCLGDHAWRVCDDGMDRTVRCSLSGNRLALRRRLQRSSAIAGKSRPLNVPITLD